MTLKPPHKHAAKLHGRNVFTFFVRVQQSGVRDAQHDELFWCRSGLVPVVSTSAADACNYVRDLVAPYVTHPTEIECLGPKGGQTHRFIGWDSLMAAKMLLSPFDEQLTLA